MRKAEARPCEDTPPPGSVDPTAPTGRPGRSGQAMAQTLYLCALRPTCSICSVLLNSYSPRASATRWTVSAGQHRRPGGNGPAATAVARLDLGDIDQSSGRHDHYTADQVLQDKDRCRCPTPCDGRTSGVHRCAAGAGARDSRSGLFWHEQRSSRYTKQAIAGAALTSPPCRRRPPQGRTGPRLHDLRHSDGRQTFTSNGTGRAST